MGAAPAVALRERAEEVLHERGQVARALAERGQADRDDVQAVVEVVAEAPLAHQRLEIAVRRGHDADVDADRRPGRRRA